MDKSALSTHLPPGFLSSFVNDNHSDWSETESRSNLIYISLFTKDIEIFKTIIGPLSSFFGEPFIPYLTPSLDEQFYFVGARFLKILIDCFYVLMFEV